MSVDVTSNLAIPSPTSLTGSTPAQVKQLSNCMPNQYNKYIDYVITFNKTTKSDEKSKLAEEIRKEFFDELTREGFEIEHLDVDQGAQTQIYALLHCPTDRLLQEAETIRLEMKLNTASLRKKGLDENYENIKLPIPCIDWLRKKLKRPLKQDPNTGSVIISAPYENSIRFIFEGLESRDDDPNYRGPFTTRIRGLLVDHILKNLTLSKFDTKKKTFTQRLAQLVRHRGDKDKNPHLRHRRPSESSSDSSSHNSNESENREVHEEPGEQENLKKFIHIYKGLPYMLNDKIFTDAFILHEDMNLFVHLHDRIDPASVSHQALMLSSFKSSKETQTQEDARKDLYMKWARLRCFFRYQPIQLIRNYFGEMFTIYFAWIGILVTTLWIPTIIGLGIFIYGLQDSLRNTNVSYISNLNKTALESAAIYGNYYLNAFAKSFDNEATPYFALVICLWGACFMEYWRRENARLAYEWDVYKYEKTEPDLPDYVRHKRDLREKLAKSSQFVKYLYQYDIYFKYLVSILVLIVMLILICIEIAITVLYRIAIKVNAYPDDAVFQSIVGDFGSSLISAIFMLVFGLIYDWIAKKLTAWESHRTQTEVDDALIYKLFAFEFLNSYGPLFYTAFFRQTNYVNGIFNLGPKYQDSCEEGNCMALLTIQVFVVLMVKPLPNFFNTVFLPLLKIIYQQIKLRVYRKKRRSKPDAEENNEENRNRNYVLTFVTIEKNKAQFTDSIVKEYKEKVILFGLIVMFACSFSLGPLAFIIIAMIDLRVDAFRFLLMFQRPVGTRAQDIGAWFNITRFLNVVGIITNGFIIGFTSRWSVYFLNDSVSNRLIFVAAFEHVVFFLWILIILIFPHVPRYIKHKMRKEGEYSKELVTSSKILKDQLTHNLRTVLNDTRTKEEAKESDRKKTRDRLTKYKKPEPTPQKAAAKKKPTEGRKPSEPKSEEILNIEPVKDKKAKSDLIKQTNGSVVSDMMKSPSVVSTSSQPLPPESQAVKLIVGRISSSDIIVQAGDDLFEENHAISQRPVTSHSKHAAFRSKIAPIEEDAKKES